MIVKGSFERENHRQEYYIGEEGSTTLSYYVILLPAITAYQKIAFMYELKQKQEQTS